MIRIENLSHRYPGADEPALHNVNLNIAAGEAVGLLGPNGAGKTTLMSLLAGLQNIQSGQISFNGKPLAKLNRAEKQQISLVPQDFAFYPLLSVWENMQFFASLYRISNPQHLLNLIEQTGLSAHRRKLAKNLSGGLKRRLNFAIGLINSPKLIFLDEITVGIDPESRQFILDSVAELSRQGITVIYTSHYLQEIEELCRQLVLLSRGRIVYQGRVGDIVQQNGQAMLTFKTTPPLSAQDLTDIGGRLNAQHAVQIAADSTRAEAVWQTLAQKGYQIELFSFGHGSLESFYLDFLKQQA